MATWRVKYLTHCHRQLARPQKLTEIFQMVRANIVTLLAFEQTFRYNVMNMKLTNVLMF